MDRRVTCQVCKRTFVALRRDATTCSSRCRKAQSRASKRVAAPSPVAPAAVTVPVTAPVVLAAPPRGGWLPVVAAPAEPPEPEPEPGVKVPTHRDEVWGRFEEYVECETPEAAAHWDARAWRELP